MSALAKPPPPNTLRPKWCISRGAGLLVPLVALDELPYEIQLKGVRRFMTIEDARHMECLGEFEHDDLVYALENSRDETTSSAKRSGLSDQVEITRHCLKEAVVKMPMVLKPCTKIAERHVSDSTVVQPTTSHAAKVAAPVHHQSVPSSVQQTQTQHFTSSPPYTTAHPRVLLPSTTIPGTLTMTTTARPLPPSGIEPDESKKKYCSYWIRNGECDFAQQGCRFRHEMPDAVTLRQIGFRGVPAWWRERGGVGAGAVPGTGLCGRGETGGEGMDAERKTGERKIGLSPGEWFQTRLSVPSKATRTVLTTAPHPPPPPLSTLERDTAVHDAAPIPDDLIELADFPVLTPQPASTRPSSSSPSSFSSTSSAAADTSPTPPPSESKPSSTATSSARHAHTNSFRKGTFIPARAEVQIQVKPANFGHTGLLVTEKSIASVLRLKVVEEKNQRMKEEVEERWRRAVGGDGGKVVGGLENGGAEKVGGEKIGGEEVGGEEAKTVGAGGGDGAGRGRRRGRARTRQRQKEGVGKRTGRGGVSGAEPVKK